MSVRITRAALGVVLMLLLAACGQSSNPNDVAETTPDTTASAAVASATPGPTGATPTFVPTPLPLTTTPEAPPSSTPPPEPPTATVEPPTPLVLPPTVTLAPATATAKPPTATSEPPTSTVPAPTNTSIPPTPVPGTPTAMPAEQLAGKIFYLANDGATINTVRSDGSGAEFVLTLEKQPEEVVVGLVGEPSGRFLLYGLQATTEQWPRYFLVERGQATSIFAFASIPRWSPDGTRFVAQVPEQSGAPGPIYLYDTASHRGQTLPVAGKPDWFPDGRRLVYVADDVFVYDLQTGADNRLTTLPDEGDEGWGIQEAHVLPDGAHIIFAGAQRKNVGASGNGLQWWAIPVSGGEMQAISDPGGNGITGFEISPRRDMLAYSEGAHSSACVSFQSVIVTTTDTGPGIAFALPVPADIRVTESGAYTIKGFSWAPDNDHIAYAIEPYRCLEGADGPTTDPPRIYLWDIRKGNGSDPLVPQTVVDGQYPVWIR